MKLLPNLFTSRSSLILRIW